MNSPFANFSISTRLRLGFGCVVGLFVIVAVLGYGWLSGAPALAERISSSNAPKIHNTVILIDTTHRMRASARLISLSTDPAAMKAEKANFDRLVQLFNMATSELEDLQKQVSGDAERATGGDLFASGRAMIEALQANVKLSMDGQREQAGKQLIENVTPKIQTVMQLLPKYFDALIERNSDATHQLESTATRTLWVLEGGSLAALVLGFLIAALVTRSITRPVQDMVTKVERLAGGDLTVEFETGRGDEIGRLGSALAQTAASLNQSIGNVLQSAEQVAQAAGNLSGSATKVRASTEEQSESTLSMAASLEQLSTSVAHVADLSDQAREHSTSSTGKARAGASTIAAMLEEVNRVAGTMESTSGEASRLGQESERISTIVNVIRDLADQTNLLALNAAIEAARAGEQGRGFAVVADEVRKLAEKTTSSALQITDMVRTIQNGTQGMAKQMAETVGSMRVGVTRAHEAESSMREIEGAAQGVLEVIDAVAAALKEQVSASHHLSSRVDHIAAMTERNSATAATVSTAAQDMARLSEGLRSNVQRFRVRH
ncbi:MAG: methyl-accepting chemotaxis protein [Rhodocyclaceae bacterium]|nr:methyl-accepting chemotaxis protein [Rhodocyclaceae bacterium]MBX3669436.1 methyl-accepting chemotaxis protein [Rhodocyclaceae bacterium]